MTTWTAKLRTTRGFIAKNWLAVLFLLMAINGVIGLLLDPEQRFLVFFFLVFLFYCCFAPEKVFRFKRSGPVPWYASAFIWIGIPVAGFLMWFTWLRA